MAKQAEKPNIENVVVDLILNLQCMKIDRSQINEKSRFKENLGMESLDQVELIMALEETFGLVIPDDDADCIKTVGDATLYVENRYNGEYNPPHGR